MAVDISKAFKLQEGGPSVKDVFTSPSVLINLLVKNIFVIASLILFFFILFGGMTMILNAGNAEKQKQGSKTLGSALTGFIILFSAYWIIRLIEGITGIQILEPGI